MILKTSEEWFEDYKKEKQNKMLDIIIYDADGWRDGKCNFYKDKITQKDFTKRIVISTLLWKNIKDDI